MMLTVLLLTASCRSSIGDIPVVYAADLIASCPAISKLPAGTTVYGLEYAYINLKGNYRDCAARHFALVKSLPKEQTK